MADDSGPMRQDEIEQLLAQAKPGGPSASVPPAAPAVPETGKARAAGTVAQDEVEALLAQSGLPRRPTPASRAAAAESSGPPGDDIELLLRQAEQALASVEAPSLPSALASARPFAWDDLSGAPPSTDGATLEILRDVELDVRIELGRTNMVLEEVLRLRKGAVVSLDKLAGDPVDIFVNGRLIARGEVLVLNDNFCVRVAELMSGEGVPAS